MVSAAAGSLPSESCDDKTLTPDPGFPGSFKPDVKMLVKARNLVPVPVSCLYVPTLERRAMRRIPPRRKPIELGFRPEDEKMLRRSKEDAERLRWYVN